MKVRATRLGYYGGHLIQPGTVFEFSGKKLGSWMEPAEASKAPKAPKVEQIPGQAPEVKPVSTTPKEAPEGSKQGEAAL